MQNGKIIPIEEAASLVHHGDMLGLGGMTIYRRPVAFVRSLIQRYQSQNEPGELALLAFTAGLESDLLVGAGMISSVRTCYFGLEIFGLAPMFTYCAGAGSLEIIEETEASLSFGLRAAMSGVGFMPGRAWLGTDLPDLRPDVKTILDPYSGEQLVAFPAIHPDVAVIHALRADPDGNAVIGNNKGVDEELSITAKTVIVTCEEIVPELDHVDLVAHFVDAVVRCPQGASPTSCHPLYPVDGDALLDYSGRVSDPASFAVFLENWLKGS
jgi:glutaconate CoA-transferase subunit A